MKKRFIPCFMAVMLVVALLLSGCGGGDQPPAEEPEAPAAAEEAEAPEAPAAAEEAETPAAEQEITSQPASSSGGGDLSELLAKARDIDQMYLESLVTVDGEVVFEGKTWFKGSKVRDEITYDDETIVSVNDTATGEGFDYYPDKNEVILKTIDPEMIEEFSDITDFTEVLDPDLARIVGTETIDGHKCKEVVMTNDQSDDEFRMWISEQYGVVVRVEDMDGSYVSEYKNLKVGLIPDDVFEIPEGAEVLDGRDAP